MKVYIERPVCKDRSFYFVCLAWVIEDPYCCHFYKIGIFNSTMVVNKCPPLFYCAHLVLKNTHISALFRFAKGILLY
ncbi:MAG: hypothetical protein WBB17_08180, partial [Saprospiraceae bacterium]